MTIERVTTLSRNQLRVVGSVSYEQSDAARRLATGVR